MGDDDASPGQLVLDVSMAEVDAVVEPDGVLNDFSRKSVALVWAFSAFHPRIVGSRRWIWQYLAEHRTTNVPPDAFKPSCSTWPIAGLSAAACVLARGRGWSAC